jgi:transposase
VGRLSWSRAARRGGLRRHREGVLAYMETKLTNGLMEAVNGLLQLAKRIARGFRNFHYFRLAAYLKGGGLNLHTPRPIPS